MIYDINVHFDIIIYILTLIICPHCYSRLIQQGVMRGAASRLTCFEKALIVRGEQGSAASAIVRRRSVLLCARLPPGHYVVVPSMWEPSLPEHLLEAREVGKGARNGQKRPESMPKMAPNGLKGSIFVGRSCDFGPQVPFLLTLHLSGPDGQVDAPAAEGWSERRQVVSTSQRPLRGLEPRCRSPTAPLRSPWSPPKRGTTLRGMPLEAGVIYGCCTYGIYGHHVSSYTSSVLLASYLIIRRAFISWSIGFSLSACTASHHIYELRGHGKHMRWATSMRMPLGSSMPKSRPKSLRPK